MDNAETFQMTVSTERARVPVTVLHINGRLNLGTSEQLTDLARDLIHGGARNLVLDLAGVLSITSAGLRAINHIVKMLHDTYPSIENLAQGQPIKEQQMKLANPSPDVRRVLEIAGFDLFLEIYPDVKSALGSF